jgi:hypothetical protein
VNGATATAISLFGWSEIDLVNEASRLSVRISATFNPRSSVLFRINRRLTASALASEAALAESGGGVSARLWHRLLSR